MRGLNKIDNSKNSKSTSKRISFEEQVGGVEIKNREKFYFENVFKDLCALEKEPSSDENSKEKKYLREIEEKVKLKQMKIQNNGFKSKTMSLTKKNKSKKKIKSKENNEDVKNEGLPEKKKIFRRFQKCQNRFI